MSGYTTIGSLSLFNIMKSQKQRHIVLLLALLFASLGAYVEASDGETGYEFLNVTPSSHIYALGGRNISLVDDDISLIYQNPALLGTEMHLLAGVNYMRYLGGSNFMGAACGVKLHERGAMALGIQYYGYGSMKQTEIDGTVSGTFSPSDISFNLSYSHDVTEMLRGGITMKVISSNYERYSALAIATDLGINYYNPDKDLSLSLVFRNLGGQVKKFDDASVSLPWDLQLGYTQSLYSVPLRISITAHDLNRWKMPYYKKPGNNVENEGFELSQSFMSSLFRHLTFGLEYVASDKFYIALGYSYKTRTDMTTYARNFLSGFSAGAGIRAKMLGFGVALSQPHVGGTTFMFNVSCNISEFLN